MPLRDDESRRAGGSSMALRAAFPATIPVMTGFLCLGTAYGLLMQSKGYGPGWSVLMSAIAFGGSMQFVAVTLLTTAFDPVQAFLLSVMVNARHMFYGLSLLDKYKGLGKVRAFLIYVLCDETFSLVSTLEPPEGVARRDFYFWLSLLDYLYWITGTALGGLAGNLITFDTTGLDFALTALFVVLFLEQWKKPENRPAGVMGILCAAASLAVFGADNMVIPAMALVLAVLLGALLAVPGEEAAPCRGDVSGQGPAAGHDGTAGGVLPAERLLAVRPPRGAGADRHRGGDGAAHVEAECAAVHRRGHCAVYGAGAGGICLRNDAGQAEARPAFFRAVGASLFLNRNDLLRN